MTSSEGVHVFGVFFNNYTKHLPYQEKKKTTILNDFYRENNTVMINNYFFTTNILNNYTYSSSVSIHEKFISIYSRVIRIYRFERMLQWNTSIQRP